MFNGIRHYFASTSNSQQNSGLSDNETPGPSNVNANIQSTSGHGSSQNRDTFSNTVGGRNNGNLEIGDAGHGLNRMFGSSNLFPISRSQKPISLSQMEHALNIWENNITQDDERRCIVKDKILECFQKRDTVLNLGGLKLKSLPEEIGNLTWLSELNLSGNQLTELPDSIGSLTRLNELKLSYNQLTVLPHSIGNLTRLSKLNLLGNRLTALPDSIGNLARLSELDLLDNQLTELPRSIGNLTRLNELKLSYNQLTELPDSIGNLTRLNELKLFGNQLTELPHSFGNLTRLSELDLSRNKLTELPNSFGNLTRLRKLKLSDNQLTELRYSFGNLTRLNELELSSNRLTVLPDFIGNLTRLGELHLSLNRLTALPNSLGNLTELRSLFLTRNQLTELPHSIGNLTRLSHLNLNYNQLTALPHSLGNLSRLRRLDLSFNQLTALPQGIFRLSEETEIRLEQNPLSQQTIAALTQQTDGPQINFSIFEIPSAQALRSRGRSFENAIRHYCSDISPEHLHNLQGAENADYFGQLLNRLDGTTGAMASADASWPGFADRVAAVIRTLAEVDSAELRTNCYLQAQDGLQTCSDRVAITFSDIEVACKSHRILQVGGGQAQMASLLRGVFRLNTLDAFARSDIATRRGVDQIEVLLAYRVGLKKELELPFETSAMNHNAISGVNRAALDRAKAHVLKIESAHNSAALVDFAIEQPFWNTYIEKNQSFQKQKQDIEADFQIKGEKLEESAKTIGDDKYVQEYNTLAADRVATLRNMQREYTREILHQRPSYFQFALPGWFT